MAGWKAADTGAMMVDDDDCACLPFCIIDGKVVTDLAYTGAKSMTSVPSMMQNGEPGAGGRHQTYMML